MLPLLTPPGPLTVLIGGLQDPQVSRPCDPPGGVLHVIALPVDGPVLVGETEGGLDVRTHVGQHGLLDRNSFHRAANLTGTQGKPGQGRNTVVGCLFERSI